MKALLTGASGMLGSSITSAWQQARPGDELVPITRQQADLRDPGVVSELIAQHQPDTIIHAAARVGGIADKLAHPAGYLRDNLLIDSAVIGAAIDHGTPEVLYIGSAAVYPEAAAQPIGEDALLTGVLEGPNEPYSIAKIAGAKLCEYASRELGRAFRVVLPSNLYGIRDNFDPASAHLVAAALAKVDTAHDAGDATVSVWGDGTARREFTFSSDLAEWLVGQVGSLEAWPDRLNVGAGIDHSIAEYYEIAVEVVGFTGELAFDTSRPSGVPQRLLDSTRARALGWAPSTHIRDGMTAVYESFRRQKGQ